ncbi:MAG: ester cyclase, partial [Anaerolineae bacterium]|nr:ester cyclase [Anaerolineae bacterium]
EGDKIVTRWTATATHTGDLFGMPPTNKDVTMMGITIFRVADGQIQELWDVWDQAGLMEQLNN